MPSPRPLIALLAAAVALPVAGCGSSEDGLLSDRQASRLLASLEQARRAADDGKCNVAGDAARRGAERAAGLPARIDRELQQNLQDGFNHLVDQINAACGREEEREREPTSTPTETSTPEPSPTETSTPEPTPTETSTPEPTPTETATPAPTETATAPPDTGGTDGGELEDGAGAEGEGIRQVGSLEDGR